jgi:hypothetical protein
MTEQEKQILIAPLQRQLEPDKPVPQTATPGDNEYMAESDAKLEELLRRSRLPEPETPVTSPKPITSPVASPRSDVVKCPNCGWQFHAGETAR